MVGASCGGTLCAHHAPHSICRSSTSRSASGVCLLSSVSLFHRHSLAARGSAPPVWSQPHHGEGLVMFARTHRRSRRSARRLVGPWIGRRLAIEPLEERRLLSADPYLFQQKLVAWGSDQASGLDEFGSSVSVDGNFMVVGAPRRQTAAAPPAAYVFQRNDQGTPSDQSDDTWDPHAVLTASDVAAPDYFGFWSVSISGGTVVVGGPND